MPYYLTWEAKADLKDIARYTEKIWGRQQRNAYLEKIDLAFHELAANPERGQGCNEIRQGYRKYRIAKHLIYYRMTDRYHIEVIRVLHGSMDIEGRLQE